MQRLGRVQQRRELELRRKESELLSGVADEVLAAYDASVETLARLGARIVRPALPHRFSDYAAATGRIIGAEGYRFVGDLVDDMSLPVDPHIRPRIQLGRNVSARDYLLALAQMSEHRREFAAALGDADALLTPTAQTAPLPIDKVDQSGTAAHFTRPGNYLGLCGLAVPNGFTPRRMDENTWNACAAWALGRAYVVSTDPVFMQAYSDTMDELERRDSDRDGALPRDRIVKAAETAPTFYYALAVDALVTPESATAAQADAGVARGR